MQSTSAVLLSCEIVRRVIPSSVLSFDFEDSHHALVFVIQDVTVKHPFSGEVVKSHDEAHRFMLGNVHRVLPAPIRLRNSIPIDDLELEAVQMERMIHADEVLDLPDLRGAKPGGDIDATGRSGGC
jgi:hypothetical protein